MSLGGVDWKMIPPRQRHELSQQLMELRVLALQAERSSARLTLVHRLEVLSARAQGNESRGSRGGDAA